MILAWIHARQILIRQIFQLVNPIVPKIKVIATQSAPNRAHPLNMHLVFNLVTVNTKIVPMDVVVERLCHRAHQKHMLVQMFAVIRKMLVIYFAILRILAVKMTVRVIIPVVQKFVELNLITVKLSF